MERSDAIKILEETKENYDLVAENFSRTRQSAQELQPLAEFANNGDKVLDLGCGNGRLLEIFQGKNIDYAGIDISKNLIQIAKKEHPERNFQVFDSLTIPFRNERFDVVFSIAVFHHIPSQQLRQELLQEAKRVLKPGGRLILTVWHLWQKGAYWCLFFNFTIKKLLGKSKLDFFDIKEPWFKISTRYFHLFRKSEFKKEVKKAGFIIEKAGFIKKGENNNILIIAKK